MTEHYHYTECGLDNIWLVNGFEIAQSPAGPMLKIKNIEGLHRAIGSMLVANKKNLTGKELRFLRQEMMMSQSSLAKLLEVTEQTVHRWETGKADMPKAAEALVRMLYGETVNPKPEDRLPLKEALEKLADLEDRLDSTNFSYKRSDWQADVSEAA